MHVFSLVMEFVEAMTTIMQDIVHSPLRSIICKRDLGLKASCPIVIQ